MSYTVLSWALRLFLLIHVVSHTYALEMKKRASSPGEEWKAAQARYDAVRQKQQQILKANAAEANAPAWAGSYFQGDGLGMNVTVVLSDKAGVAVVMNGDVGNYEGSVGSVVALPNGRLAIRLEHPVMGFDSGEYVPTKWAGRMYLIQSDELTHFASDINADFEPREDRFGSYFLREGMRNFLPWDYPLFPLKNLLSLGTSPCWFVLRPFG